MIMINIFYYSFLIITELYFKRSIMLQIYLAWLLESIYEMVLYFMGESSAAQFSYDRASLLFMCDWPLLLFHYFDKNPSFPIPWWTPEAFPPHYFKFNPYSFSHIWIFDLQSLLRVWFRYVWGPSPVTSFTVHLSMWVYSASSSTEHLTNNSVWFSILVASKIISTTVVSV